jgi:serine/threonine-protein kinase
VAIKTVKLPDNADPETEEALARFRREAQAAGRLTHPNIVGVFDYGETSDLAYIVMEFVEGPSLKTLLDRHEHFAITDMARVMQDLLAGLQFSHERGVVHRDIKPANVMLTDAGQAKIADFGIARIDSSSMTQAGTLLGTPAYMSPEQFMGNVVDARSDIYSSGVLLYQMLTGDRPFEGSLSAIMHKVLNTDPPAPSVLSVTAPPSLDAVVRRAMSRRPEDRFPSAGAFAEAIRGALSNQAEAAVGEGEATLVARSTQPPPAPRRTDAPSLPRGVPAIAPVRRSRVPTIATAVILLAAVGGGAWWFLADQPTPTPQVIETATVTSPPVADAANPAGIPAPTPQPPPPPEVPPDRQQPATAGLDALRGQVAHWASSRICAMLGGEVGDNGSVTVDGLAGNGSVEGLRQGLMSFVPPGQIDFRVAGVDRVFCPALTTLRPIAPAYGAPGGPHLGLQMDGKARLHDGEPVRARLVMPDFTSHLRVDYMGHDGSVQHLYPQLADPKSAITADPPRTFGPGEALNLGHPSWLIGEPYGTDMIIAIASSEPLFDRPRPGNAETAEVYLRDLQSSIDTLRRRGARLAGAAVTLEALPK